MIQESVRLSGRAREHLITMKRRTGIYQWNILCRWALCMSLADPTPPSGVAVSNESTGETGVEMEWKTFAGEAGDLYTAVVRQRCVNDGLGTDSKVVREQLRLHLHRGIGMLAGIQSVRSIEDLMASVETWV